MIFKRKQVRPAEVGTICSIKNSVIEQMKRSEYYKENSVVHYKTVNDYGEIIGSDLRKGAYRNQVFLADCTMVYVEKKTSFDGILKVLPLTVQRDGRRGYAALSLFKNKKSYMVPVDSLSLLSNGEIETKSDHLVRWAKDDVARKIDSILGVNKFEWENK